MPQPLVQTFTLTALTGGGLVPPIPGGALITSLAAQTQPGATQRYYQATANRAGTWAISTGATMDATTGIWSLNANNTGDGSAQIIRTPTITFTPTDGTAAVTQLTAITLTVIAAPSSASISDAADFTGTAGTKLSSLPGWTISRDVVTDPIGDPVLTGDGRITGFDGNLNGNGTWALLRSPGGDNKGSTLRYTFDKNTTQRTTRIFTNASDWKNGVLWQFLGDANTIQILAGKIYQANVATDFSGPGTGSVAWPQNGKIVVTFATSADGNAVTLTVVGTSTQTYVLDITGKTLLGPKFGFRALDTFFPTMESGAFVSALDYVKAATVLSITDVPLYSADNRTTATLAWGALKPIGMQYQSYDEATGIAASAWMTGDATVTGTTSGTVTVSVTAPKLANLRLRFRPLNDTGVVVIAPQPTLFGANVIPFQAGFNVPSANYFQPCPMLSNYGKYAAIVAPGQLRFPIDGMDGFANIVSTPGTNFTGFSNANDQIVSKDTAAGTLRVRMVDNAGSADRILNFTGTTPTKFDATRDGLGLIAPEWLAGMEGAEVIRDLDMTLQNKTPANLDVVSIRNTPADGFYRNDTGVGPDAPYQDRVRGLAAYAASFPAFKTWWKVLEVNLTDTQIIEAATFERDNYPADKNIVLQFGNEIHWNTDFSGVRRVALDGLRNGHYGAATASAPQPGLIITEEGGGYPGTTASGQYASVKTTHDVAAGDYITCNVYSVGNVVYRAKQFAPAGTYVADGTVDGSGNVTSVSENAYFTKDLTKDLLAASRKWEAVRLNQIIELYRGVFGATRFAAQIKPVLMGQAVGTLYDQLAIARDYVPGFFAKIWGAGNGWYFYSEPGYNSATATAANLEASFRANMPALKADIRQSVVDALRMGKVPCFYEGIDHQNGNLGVAGMEAYTAAWFARQNSDVGKQFISDAVFFMKTNVPGLVVGYDLVARSPWSIKNGWRDLTNKRRLGWLDGLARTS